MNKVEIFVFNKRALVDEDMVKKMLKKDALVKECSALRQLVELQPLRKVELFERQTALAKKIINLNRTIRQNVQFL